MKQQILLEKKISAIALGCDKNRVDLEHMLGALKDFGFNIIEDIDDAQIIIVNTCAFISPAVKEAIDNILLAINQKKYKCEKVIVTGCINERYLDELKAEMPEVDAFVKIKDNDQIIKTILSLYNQDINGRIDNKGRLLTTYSHYAYLKIADGCNNGCAYCTIPRIRGRYKSVPMEDIVKEAKELVSKGVKELIIVAQDITRYGEDLYNKFALIELLEKLTKIKNLQWIRLHYLYPEMIDEKLLDYIYSNDKICKYLDIPLQHIDDKILYDMNRRCDETHSRKLIDLINQKYPKITLRTTYIVGFPGETKKQFNKLLDFLKTSKIPNVGFFSYFREDKTKAYYMKNQVKEFIKKSRLKKAQKIQEQIATQHNLKRQGEITQVIVDYFDEQTGYYIGRDQYNSPNVDFFIEIIDNNNVVCGNIYNVKLLNYNNGIFKGEIV